MNSVRNNVRVDTSIRLQYEPPDKQTTKKKTRKKTVRWFNPPFSLSVKTNVGKKFLSLLDRSFPANNPLSKLFNRHTVKIGYKCMPNMATNIASHNSKVVREDNPVLQPQMCSCEGGTPVVQFRGLASRKEWYIEPALPKPLQEKQKPIQV